VCVCLCVCKGLWRSLRHCVLLLMQQLQTQYVVQTALYMHATVDTHTRKHTQPAHARPPPTYIGCGTKEPRQANNHMGRAPHTKKPLCFGPGVPLSGST